MVESPGDYYIDSLLRSLENCEKTGRQKDCAFYLDQLNVFVTDYAGYMRQCEQSELLVKSANHYKLISAKSPQQINISGDRGALQSMYGPRAATRYAIRRWLSQ